MSNQNKQPHPHAETIRAWADGSKIEYRVKPGDEWLETMYPSWSIGVEYRVKPEAPERRIEPKHGDTYLYIDSDGIVVATIWENRGVDDRRRYFGNYFTSEREAKIAAVRVKEVLENTEQEANNEQRERKNP